MAINKISDEQLYKIIKKSAKALPNRPTRAGYTAEEIKKHLTDFVLGDEDSIKAELDRIVDEINDELEKCINKEDLLGQFSQNLYDESANLAHVPDILETTKSGLTYSAKDGIITINGTATENVELISLFANLVSGKTYAFNYFNTSYSANFQWGLYSNNEYAGGIFDDKGTKALTKNVYRVNLTALSGTVFDNQQFKPMIVEGNIVPTTYFANNPKYHITNSEAEFLKEKSEESYNIFGGNVKTVNNLLFYGGTTVSRTDISQGLVYIPIKNNTDYSLRIFDYTDFIRKALFVNEPNKVGITYIDSSFTTSLDALTAGITFNSGEANFLAFSDVSHSKFETFIKNVVLIEGTTIPTKKFEYNSSSHITNAQADLLKSECDKNSNLFVKSLIENNKELNSDGSTRANSGWYVSSYMNVKGFPYVYVSGSRSTGAGFCFYDENKNFLSRFDIHEAHGKFTGLVTIPSNAIYMRCNGYNTEIDFMINKGTEPLPYMEGYGKTIHEVDITPTVLFEGKTVESLTLTDNVENYDYVDIFYFTYSGNSLNSMRISTSQLTTSGDIVIVTTEIHNNGFPEDYGLINNFKSFTLNGKNLTVNTYGRWWRYLKHTTFTMDTNNDIRIYKILGYKEAK